MKTLLLLLINALDIFFWFDPLCRTISAPTQPKKALQSTGTWKISSFTFYFIFYNI